jgi:hypothetical protein
VAKLLSSSASPSATAFGQQHSREPFCFKKQGIGSLAFKIALDQALMVNEVMAQEWLSLHLHIHDSDAD